MLPWFCKPLEIHSTRPKIAKVSWERSYSQQRLVASRKQHILNTTSFCTSISSLRSLQFWALAFMNNSEKKTANPNLECLVSHFSRRWNSGTSLILLLSYISAPDEGVEQLVKLVKLYNSTPFSFFFFSWHFYFSEMHAVKQILVLAFLWLYFCFPVLWNVSNY